MEKEILQKWLKAGFMEKYVLHAMEEGTVPLTSVVSAEAMRPTILCSCLTILGDSR